MDRNRDDESRTLGELRQAWAQGARPSDLLRLLVAKGVGGAWMLDLMERAFGLPFTPTKSITAWETHQDDERLNRYLARFMPARE